MLFSQNSTRNLLSAESFKLSKIVEFKEPELLFGCLLSPMPCIY